MHFFPNHMLLAYQTSLLCGHSVLTERFAQYDIVPHKMGLACTHHSWCLPLHWQVSIALEIDTAPQMMQLHSSMVPSNVHV